MKLLDYFLSQLNKTKKSNNLLDELQSRIGYHYKNLELLIAALTHTSVVGDKQQASPFERMEFLGDSVLGLIAAEYIFTKYPKANEGKLAKIKAKIVSQKYIYIKAKEINLGKYIILSKEAELGKGRESASIVTDILEALICSIYIDSSYEEAKKFVLKYILNDIDKLLKLDSLKNYKSILQEKIQSKYKTIPVYRVIEESGPEHNKYFTVEVIFKGKILGIGKGRSKKEAQQNAAKSALTLLKI